MNIFYLDFETTGLNPYLSDIIEIAIKKKDEESFYQTLVKPKKMPRGSLYRYIPPDIVSLTGITDKMVQKDGVEVSIAVYNMYRFIENKSEEGEPIYIVSHNGNSFDFIFFRRLISKYQKEDNTDINHQLIQSIRYIDTLLLAKIFSSKNERLSQPKLCEKYKIINEKEHRALGDIKALEQLYNILCKKYAEYKEKEENYYLEHPNEIELFI